ncbi:MAG: SLC13 family permease [Sedimentibacter sp.]|uniref:SLC13 family permease n=1 Tax=Sedimentibacter sp. TaxID=1960295 RepID=UPI003159849D
MIFGAAVAVTINLLPLEGLTYQGKMCLGLTLMTVVFWAFQVVQSGYSSGLYLVLLVIFKVAEPSAVFSPWLGSTMYMVVGAYLIASAVKASGLGERIAYKFIIRYVSSYKSIIISIFMLTLVLSVLIPHPWPRAFIIMSVMAVVIKNARIPREDASKIGFAVFAAAVSVSMIFLTGDSVINPLAAQASGESISWIKWFVYMGPPNIIASIITCALILVLFKPTAEVRINKDEIREKLIAMGPVSAKEKRTAVWLAAAVVLWMTDSVHGINIGWITLLIAMLMSFPVVGEILTAKQWGEVPVHVLLFLSAAMAIGRIGGITGMNDWIADTILPSSIPSNPFVLAILISVISMVIHMFLGSVITVIGIAIPALLLFTQPSGISPVVTSLLVYTAAGIHYILPFHHLNILVGMGEENGMYTQKEVARLGIPLTAVVFLITAAVEVPYWKFIGLL